MPYSLAVSDAVAPVAPVSNQISDRFGARLRALRKAKGYTQVDLADYLGIDRSYLSDVERGKKNISLSYLETIALGFNLSLSELLSDIF